MLSTLSSWYMKTDKYYQWSIYCEEYDDSQMYKLVLFTLTQNFFKLISRTKLNITVSTWKSIQTVCNCHVNYLQKDKLDAITPSRKYYTQVFLLMNSSFNSHDNIFVTKLLNLYKIIPWLSLTNICTICDVLEDTYSKTQQWWKKRLG